MSVRVYRTLLLLYPKSFRRTYGEDMVAVFEEMRRDRSPVALWWRVAVDATTSITVQRMETVMSNRNPVVPLGLASLAAVLLVVFSARGIENLAVFAFSVLAIGGLAVAALVYWYNQRPYVEPSDRLDRYWLRFLGGGALLIGLVNLGTGVDIDAPWLVLFTSIILGIMLIGIGLILGVWRGVDRVRSN